MQQGQPCDQETRSSFCAGRYLPLRVLGVGGQKLVYLVRDSVLDRECAFAFLKASELTTEQLGRFRAEAQAVARLGSHPHLVAVFDLGDDEGRPFVVSEFVPGGDVRDLLAERRGPLAVAEALSIGAGVLRALAFIHPQRVFHRDVKPANVWIADAGSAKLGDFGIASSEREGASGDSGGFAGTPQYMAPEQIRGESVGPPADLYSFGCMLHELLSGEPPFTGTIRSVLAQQLKASPRPPSLTNPTVPPELDALVLSLLEKAPANRPQSADEVLDELGRFAGGGAVAASTVSPIVGSATHLRPRSGSGLGRTVFAGREQELGSLHQALDRALLGSGEFWSVSGEQGIGKSRLVRELELAARLRNARVLWGRCTDADGGAPYLPFVEVLDSLHGAADTGDLVGELAAAGDVLRQLSPRLAARLPAVDGGETVTPIDRYTLFQTVAGLLRKAAEPAGALLVLEDLHWADQPTLLMVQHLATHLANARVLVVETHRDTGLERGHPLQQMLADLRRERIGQRIALGGLSADGARQIVETAARERSPKR